MDTPKEGHLCFEKNLNKMTTNHTPEFTEEQLREIDSEVITREINRNEKHKNALNDIYERHGVGDLPKQRHNFWKMFIPGCQIYHLTTDAQLVKAYESLFLIEKYPADFHFC